MSLARCPNRFAFDPIAIDADDGRRCRRSGSTLLKDADQQFHGALPALLQIRAHAADIGRMGGTVDEGEPHIERHAKPSLFQRSQESVGVLRKMADDPMQPRANARAARYDGESLKWSRNLILQLQSAQRQQPINSDSRPSTT